MSEDVYSNFRVAQPVAQQEQIADFLRQQIRSDALPEGARLPTTQELAQRWGVTITVIQAALAPLVREGLLLRKPRVGTVVRQRPAKLSRVALYRISDPSREGADHFSRRLAAVTGTHLAARGIGAELFTDLRPEDRRSEPWSDLVQAIRGGRIDAVIACESEVKTSAWISQLPVPAVIYGAPGPRNAVGHDLGQFGREAIACLAARGCRSAGLVSVFPIDDTELDGTPKKTRDLHESFLAAAEVAGIVTRPAWIRTPAAGVFLPETRAERFGYDSIRSMWREPGRPDGVVVFTDLTARGVIMGLLSCTGDGQPLPRLVLHRNAELGLFCPIDADFLDVSLAGLADVLIGRIERQRRGEPLEWEAVPFVPAPVPVRS